jgi:Protein of unknown function (DUF2934)
MKAASRARPKKRTTKEPASKTFKEVTIVSDDAATQQSQNSSHEEIAVRAYRLWEERGCPIGSPEEDWFRAEEEIRGQPSQSQAARAASAS